MQKRIALLCVLILDVLCAGLCGALGEQANDGIDYITLYVLNDDYKDLIELPPGAMTTYRLDMPEGATFASKEIPGSEYSFDPFAITVEDGVVIPETNTNTTRRYTTVRVVVYCKAAGFPKTYNFRLYFPGYDYAENVLSQYIDSQPWNQMSQMEKLKRIASHVAEDYGYYTGAMCWREMILAGGGDCWATSDLIVEMCRRVGVPAAVRAAYKDRISAGGGHQNVITEIDGQKYIVEAAYNSPKPRDYSMWEVGDFSFYDHISKNPDESYAVAYEYEGNWLREKDHKVTEIYVPSEYKGLPVTEVSNNFVVSDSYLQVIHLPETITKIGKSAFSGCSALTHIDLPSGLKTIGEQAFCYCRKLGSVEIPEGVTVLPSKVFYTCNDLTITLPDSVTEIASDAFQSTRPTFVVSRRSYAYTYAVENGIPYRLKENVAVLPENTREIDEEAFAGCGFEGIIVPANVTRIKARAFAGCPGLKWIEIPESVTGIDQDAFAGLENVEIIRVP